MDDESQRDDLQKILNLVKENSNALVKLSNLTEEHSKQLNEFKTNLVSA